MRRRYITENALLERGREKKQEENEGRRLQFLGPHNSRILRGCYGAEGFGKPDQFHIKPKAHAEKEETSKDE